MNDDRRLLALLAALAMVGCQPTTFCDDSCRFAGDGECDDGRLGAATGWCELGTDCTDCGPNPRVDQRDSDDVRIPPDGFGQRHEPSGEGDEDWGEIPCEVGCFCSDGGQGWYCRWAVGDGEHDHVAVRCEGTVSPPWNECGRNRRCVEADTIDEGDSHPEALGCLERGASRDDIIEVCEPRGECTDGTPVERCYRYPAWIPFDAIQEGVFYGGVTRLYYRAGSVELTCAESEPGDPPWVTVIPLDCSPEGGGERPLPTLCQRAGAEDYCGPSEDPETAPEGCGETEDPDVDPSCRVQIDAVEDELDRLARSLPDACASCVTEFRSCAEASNCESIESCHSAGTSCLTSCY